jgi:hypothetical protein
MEKSDPFTMEKSHESRAHQRRRRKAAIHYAVHLADMRRREWIDRADRMDAEPPSPVADTDLLAGLVEPNCNAVAERRRLANNFLESCATALDILITGYVICY